MKVDETAGGEMIGEPDLIPSLRAVRLGKFREDVGERPARAQCDREAPRGNLKA